MLALTLWLPVQIEVLGLDSFNCNDSWPCVSITKTSSVMTSPIISVALSFLTSTISALKNNSTTCTWSIMLHCPALGMDLLAFPHLIASLIASCLVGLGGFFLPLEWHIIFGYVALFLLQAPCLLVPW